MILSRHTLPRSSKTTLLRYHVAKLLRIPPTRKLEYQCEQYESEFKTFSFFGETELRMYSFRCSKDLLQEGQIDQSMPIGPGWRHLLKFNQTLEVAVAMEDVGPVLVHPPSIFHTQQDTDPSALTESPSWVGSPIFERKGKDLQNTPWCLNETGGRSPDRLVKVDLLVKEMEFLRFIGRLSPGPVSGSGS